MTEQEDVDGGLEGGARVEPIDLEDLRELDPEAFAASGFGVAPAAVKVDHDRPAEQAD